jgi:predicted ArsR family transcriptional regulator
MNRILNIDLMAMANVEHLLKSARSAIIELLKSGGPMSAEQLAGELRVSKVSIRRHLAVLESDGLVQHQKQLKDRGRPGFLFNLTEKAECLFPRTYDEFTRGLLRQVEKQFGKAGVECVLEAQANEQIEQLKAKTEGLEFEDCLSSLAHHVSELGFEADVSAREDGSFELCQRNCPVESVASAYPQICTQELRVYREVLDCEVTCECQISDGARMCAYRVLPRVARSLRVLPAQHNA